MKLCTTEGCNKKHLAKGLCSNHYYATGTLAGDKHYAAQKRRFKTKQAALKAYKLALGGCVDCGSQELLDLDHRDDTVKLFNPAECGRSWAALLSEWAKCDVRCRPCHTSRHMRGVPDAVRKVGVLIATTRKG